MSYKEILFKKEGGIAYISLNNPPAFNAVSDQMMTELAEVLGICDASPEIGVVILSGEGKAFCAGGNIPLMADYARNKSYEALGTLVDLAGNAVRMIRQIKQPVIAKIHGSAAGGGCSLALMCDFRIVSEEVKFLEAFVNLGFVPDMGGVFALSRFVGVGRLMEYITTGAPVSAQEAYNLGMVNAVVKQDDLDAETMKWAEMILSKPRDAVIGNKKFVNNILYTGLNQELDSERLWQEKLAATDNFLEGVTAFIEKRKPDFNK